MKTQTATLIQPTANGASDQPLYRQRSTRAQPELQRSRQHGIQQSIQHGIQPGIVTTTLTGEPLTLRAAMPADAAALATMGSKGFATTHQAAIPKAEMQGVLASAWSEKQITELIANPEIQIVVAEIEQSVVGMACLNPTYRPSYLRRPTPVELTRFYLHPDWVGCGVGSKLMTYSLRQAAMTGYSLCWLRVWQGNTAAIHFYRRWGFTTIAAESYTVGNMLVPVWVMIHPLSSKEESSITQ
jgi:diamine N-acetyltransferase